MLVNLVDLIKDICKILTTTIISNSQNLKLSPETYTEIPALERLRQEDWEFLSLAT
jgi:hypothetical protein